MNMLRSLIWQIRWWIQSLMIDLSIAIAWRLPRSIVYWSYIRVLAHAAGEKYPDTLVSSLNAMVALKRWSDD